MDIISKVSSSLTAKSEEKEAKKLDVLKTRAMNRANAEYNVARIDGVDYVTFNGIPVSCPEDSKNGSICDRLETYRQNYITACINANRVIGDPSSNV